MKPHRELELPDHTSSIEYKMLFEAYLEALAQAEKLAQEHEKTLKELNEFKSQCAILVEKVNAITAMVFGLENSNKK